MAKRTTTPANTVPAEMVPDAPHALTAPAPRKLASEWERTNATVGWHVTFNDGMVACVQSVATDNATLTVKGQDGSITTRPKHDIMQVNVRPLTEWESSVVAMVHACEPLRGGLLLTTGDPLTVAHEFGRRWLALAGGSKHRRILAALIAEEKGRKAGTAPTPAPAPDATPAV